MTNLDTHWPEILDVVRQRVAQQTFNTWFIPLQPVNTGQKKPSVDCPDRFFMDWFSEHHLSALNEAGSDYFGTETLFSLQVTNVKAVEQGLLIPTPAAARVGAPEGIQAPSAPRDTGPKVDLLTQKATTVNRTRTATMTNINPEYTFDNFVVGSGTDLVFAAATAISNNPGGHFNPLFIHGGVGLGKTHLMHAIGNAIAKDDPDKRICYVTAENFMNDLIASIRDRRTRNSS